MAKRDDIVEHSLADSIGYDTYPRWLKARLEWFMDVRFGMIIHWGPYSQWDCCESWGLVPEQYAWNRSDDMKCWVERGRDFDRLPKITGRSTGHSIRSTSTLTSGPASRRPPA